MEIKTTTSAKFFNGYRTAKRLAAACASAGAHIHHDESKGSYDLIVPATGEKLSLLHIGVVDSDYYGDKRGLTTPWCQHGGAGCDLYSAWDFIDCEPHDIATAEGKPAYGNIRKMGGAEHPCTDAFLRERIRLCCIAYAHNYAVYKEDLDHTVSAGIK